MAKQVNLDQLFQQKFETYQVDVSPSTDAAMEKRISSLKWFRFLKWFFGALLITGLAFLISPSYVLDSKDIEIIDIASSHMVYQPLEHSSSRFQEDLEIEEAEIAIIFQQEEEVTVLKEQSIIADSSVDLILDHREEELPTALSPSEPIIRDINPRVPLALHQVKAIKIPSSKARGFQEKKELRPVMVSAIETKKQSPRKASDKTQTKKSHQKQQNKSEEGIGIFSRHSKKKSKKDKRKKVEATQAKATPKKQKKDNVRLLASEEKKQEPTTLVNKSPKKSKNKAIKEKRPSDFTGAIDIGISPIFLNNLSAPFEPQNDTVTNFLCNKKGKLSYDFGFEFMIKPKESDWLFKTGLHYQQLKEDIHYYFIREYIDDAQSHWIYDSIFEYHIDPPVFDTMLVGIDSSYYEHWITEERSQKYHNRYTYLNIPLLLGYQLNFANQKFKVQILTGVSMSLQLKEDGYYYDTDGYIYRYQNNQKTLIHWDLMAQAAMVYKLDRFSVFAKPQLQFQIKEKERNDYFEKRHFFIYGIEFGLRFKLF